MWEQILNTTVSMKNTVFIYSSFRDWTRVRVKFNKLIANVQLPIKNGAFSSRQFRLISYIFDFKYNYKYNPEGRFNRDITASNRSGNISSIDVTNPYKS